MLRLLSSSSKVSNVGHRVAFSENIKDHVNIHPFIHFLKCLLYTGSWSLESIPEAQGWGQPRLGGNPSKSTSTNTYTLAC